MTPAPPTLDDTLAHTEWVRRLARSLVSDADADDLAQEAWEASLAVERPTGGWFAATLRNLAAFRSRTTARRLRRDAATEPPEPDPRPDVMLERLEARGEPAHELHPDETDGLLIPAALAGLVLDAVLAFVVFRSV